MGFMLGWQSMGLRLALGIVMVFGLGYLANRHRHTERSGGGARRSSRELAAPTLADVDRRSSRWMQILGA